MRAGGGGVRVRCECMGMGGVRMWKVKGECDKLDVGVRDGIEDGLVVKEEAQNSQEC